VRDHQRDRVRVVGTDVQEVDALTGGLGDGGAGVVELGLEAAPVVAVRPVAHDRTKELLVGAVVPSCVVERCRPTRAFDAGAQVVELLVRDVDREPLHRQTLRTSADTCSM
jgi:hypothetical protein